MLTLKAIKYNKSLSEETLCFNANIYFNGKKIGTVQNRGFGGCSSYSFDKEYDMKFLEDNLSEKYGDIFKDSVYIDTFFNYLVLLNDAASELKKHLKKTIFIDSGKVMAINAPFSEDIKKRLNKEKPNAILLNDMSLEDAMFNFNTLVLGYGDIDKAIDELKSEDAKYSKPSMK